MITQQEYLMLMQRSEDLITKATMSGGFQNLPQEDVVEFGNLAAIASQYEDGVLRLYPFKEKNAIYKKRSNETTYYQRGIIKKILI